MQYKRFLMLWSVFYLCIMLILIINNLFWLSASPEYSTFKTLNWFKTTSPGMMKEDNAHFSKASYLFKYRISTVLTNNRDISSGLLTSFILSSANCLTAVSSIKVINRIASS